jgi:hypothetical protein
VGTSRRMRLRSACRRRRRQSLPFPRILSRCCCPRWDSEEAQGGKKKNRNEREARTRARERLNSSRV